MTLEELKQLCDAATPGPWGTFVEGDCDHATAYGPQHEMPNIDMSDDDYDAAYQAMWAKGEADSRFIAAARAALPKLIAVAEAAKSGSSNRISDALAALEAP